MDDEVKRIPCKNKKCDKTILEATAKKTGGYCYPCYNAAQAKEREEYIRKNRRDVDLYEGISDSVEIIKIMHLDKKYDPLIKYINYPKTKEEMYEILSKDDVDRLKNYAMELYKNDDDKWEQILLHLVCFKGADIDDCLKVLIDDCKIYEPSLFKNSSDHIAKLLIEKLKCNYDKKIYLDSNAKSENYAANEFLDAKFTKIGGMPTWIQDAEYPKCPKCGEEMMFVGQVSNEDFQEYSEGTYYGFVCNKCNIAATGYQQT